MTARTAHLHAVAAAQSFVLSQPGKIRPCIPEREGMSAARKGPGQLALHASATLALVERLGRGVLLEHPQVKSARRPAPGDRPRCPGQEPGTDTQPLEVVPDMKVVQVGTPDRVRVEDGMSEARDAAVEVRDESVPVWRGPREPAGPLGHPVSYDVAVEIRIQVRAPVVPPPAVSMQAGDRRRIARCRLAVPHIPMLPAIAPGHDQSGGAGFKRPGGCR